MFKKHILFSSLSIAAAPLFTLCLTSDWSAITGLSRHRHNHISASALLVFLQLYRLPAGSFKKLQFLKRACETMCIRKDKMGTLSRPRINFFKYYDIMIEPKLFEVTLRSTNHSPQLTMLLGVL